MNCPKCGSTQTGVTDSRPSGEGRRRRYECFDCKYRFTTKEIYVADLLLMMDSLEEDGDDG